MPRPRVVSLLASATEIVAALDCVELLVGRSHECDFPPSVRRLPVCSEPKIEVDGTSREIDERVKSAVGDPNDALSIYRVHADVLRELQPDVILTQDHCEVCAVNLKDVEQAVCEMIPSRPRIVSLSPNTLDDVWGSIQMVAEALGVPRRGKHVVEVLRTRLDAMRQTACRLAHRPTVACIEWIDPLITAGNWVPELVEVAGGANLFGEPGSHSPYLNWEQLAEADPEVIVVFPCGWDVAKCRCEMPALTGKPEWPALQAVRHQRVFLTDGNQYFNRPGPRLVESAEILVEILHPETFDFGHAGTGWERL